MNLDGSWKEPGQMFTPPVMVSVLDVEVEIILLGQQFACPGIDGIVPENY